MANRIEWNKVSFIDLRNSAMPIFAQNPK